jgi:hypothetical protein
MRQTKTILKSAGTADGSQNAARKERAGQWRWRAAILSP